MGSLTAPLRQRSRDIGLRTSLALMVLGVAPFVAAGLLAASPGLRAMAAASPLGCPLLEATGIPCPLCGATRSFVLLLDGSPEWTSFNPVWPVVALLLAAAGAAGLASERLRRRLDGLVPERAVSLLCLTFAAGWAAALTHANAISHLPLR